jgi:nicotinamidase-related amidase
METPFNNLVTPYTELHPESSVLLVIDTQNDYADSDGAYPIELFRASERTIVHIVRLYKEDGSNVDPCRRWQFESGELRSLIPGSWGSQLVGATNPTGADLDHEALLAGEVQELTPIEFDIYKPRFGAFHDTRLHEFLSAREIDSVVIVGVTFPNCVLAAQLGATDRDYRVGLIPSACTQVDDAGLAAMQNKGVQLMTLEDLRGFLGKN